MDILLYEKGEEIKHIKAPAIVKVQHTDLGKIKLLMVWNKVNISLKLYNF